MLYALTTFALATTTVLISRGEWHRFLQYRPRSLAIFAVAVIVQLLATAQETTGFQILPTALALTLSYALLVVFGCSNASSFGMVCVTVGIVLNGIAIASNGGMPTNTPRGYRPVQASSKHLPADGSEHVTWLTDVIWIPAPVSTMISVGDIAISVGVCGVAYSITRRRPDELVRAPIKGEG